MIRDPLLTFQLLALVPVVPCGVLVLVGLGSGDPWWVAGELILLALAGVVPSFLVQWQRPVVLWPWTDVAGITRGRDCAWFSGLGTREHQVVTILVGVLLLAVNRTLYHLSPIFGTLSPLRQEAPGSHFTGLLLALAGMVGLGFALQVGAAAGRLLLLSETEQSELLGKAAPPLTHLALALPHWHHAHNPADPE